MYHHKHNSKTVTAIMYANTDTSGLLSDGRLVSGSPVGGPTGRENINIFAGDRRTFANGGEGFRGRAGLWRTSLAAEGFANGGMISLDFAKRRIFVSPAGYSPKIHPPGKI